MEIKHNIQKEQPPHLMDMVPDVREIAIAYDTAIPAMGTAHTVFFEDYDDCDVEELYQSNYMNMDLEELLSLPDAERRQIKSVSALEKLFLYHRQLLSAEQRKIIEAPFLHKVVCSDTQDVQKLLIQIQNAFRNINFPYSTKTIHFLRTHDMTSSDIENAIKKLEFVGYADPQLNFKPNNKSSIVDFFENIIYVFKACINNNEEPVELLFYAKIDVSELDNTELLLSFCEANTIGWQSYKGPKLYGIKIFLADDLEFQLLVDTKDNIQKIYEIIQKMVEYPKEEKSLLYNSEYRSLYDKAKCNALMCLQHLDCLCFKFDIYTKPDHENHLYHRIKVLNDIAIKL